MNEWARPSFWQIIWTRREADKCKSRSGVRLWAVPCTTRVFTVTFHVMYNDNDMVSFCCFPLFVRLLLSLFTSSMHWPFSFSDAHVSVSHVWVG